MLHISAWTYQQSKTPVKIIKSWVSLTQGTRLKYVWLRDTFPGRWPCVFLSAASYTIHVSIFGELYVTTILSLALTDAEKSLYILHETRQPCSSWLCETMASMPDYGLCGNDYWPAEVQNIYEFLCNSMSFERVQSTVFFSKHCLRQLSECINNLVVLCLRKINVDISIF